MSVSIDLLGSQVFQLGFQLLVSNFDYLNNDVQIGIELNSKQYATRGIPLLDRNLPLYNHKLFLCVDNKVSPIHFFITSLVWVLVIIDFK